MGVVTEGNLMACLLNGRVQPEDVVASVMYRQFKKASAVFYGSSLKWVLFRGEFLMFFARVCLIIILVVQLVIQYAAHGDGNPLPLPSVVFWHNEYRYARPSESIAFLPTC